MWPASRPPAMPKSASPASPGPLTAQPMTATSKCSRYAVRRRSTVSASSCTSTLVRPHDGQAISCGPELAQAERLQDLERRRAPPRPGRSRARRGCVSPMPSREQRADADRRLDRAGEQRARPRSRRGAADSRPSPRAAGRRPIITGTFDDLTEILKSWKPRRSSSSTSSIAARTSAPAGSEVAVQRRCSGSEPELAPMRSGVPVSLRPLDDLLAPCRRRRCCRG